MEIAEKPGWGTIKMVENDSLKNSLNKLLGRFGVERADKYDSIVECAEKILQERGHQAIVVGLRHGELQVKCAGVEARLLRIDSDQVIASIEKTHPGVVQKLVIKTR